MANAKMRKTLEAGGMVVAPGAYDVPTARLLQSIGFEYLYIGGNQSGLIEGIPEPFETVTLMSQVFLRERVSLTRWTGVLLILLGTTLVASRV